MGVLLIGLISAYFITDLKKVPWQAISLGIAWLVLFIVRFWLIGLNFKRQAYALREFDLLYRKGVIFRHLLAIPFNRVQHCEIKQGPIARAFGLSTLEIYTAGGQSSDLAIPGLPADTAAQLKNFIIQSTAQYDDQQD